MSQTCDVCILAGDDDDRRLILQILTRAGYACLTTSDAGSARQIVSDNHPKVVLSDWDLLGQDGLAFCAALRDTPELSSTFFMVLCAPGDDGQCREALRHGVDDYLIKPVEEHALLARVRLGVRMWEVTSRLLRAAITDGLTGLYNHDYLNGVIEREFNRTRRYGGGLSLIMIDLDFFKAVNDTYGHLVGNATLMEVARVLRENVREFDTVGRYGGEEFVIVAPETKLDDAVAISERIRLATTETLRVEALDGHVVTASFGIAGTDDTRVRCAADLVDLADRALYAAKRAGRNRVVTAASVSDDASLTMGLDSDEVEILRKEIAVLSVQAKQVYVQSIASLLQVLDEKDPFTAKHSVNVAFYGEQIARAMNLTQSLVLSVRNAGMLHDVGKVGIPDGILTKPGPLNEAEHRILRQVPLISVRIIDHLHILENEMQIIRHQQEYFDGSGHPDRLRGQQIPVGSRILLVANAFDAMTTERLYRQRWPIDRAMDELRAGAGGQFDPAVLEAFEGIVATRRAEIEERIAHADDSVPLSATLA